VTVAVTASLSEGLGTEAMVDDDMSVRLLSCKSASESRLHGVLDVHRQLEESWRLRIEDTEPYTDKL
jgi:hypothetical protein